MWAEQSGSFAAAVASGASVPLIGMRPFVPDHKIFFVEFDQAQPAYYLCGLLTSTLAKEFVESHNISIQVGDIFKHMKLPAYNPDEVSHLELAALVMEAHDTHNSALRSNIVAEIRDFADELIQSL